MSTRLQGIRARQIVREENYSVHVACLSEVEATADGLVCCNCGRVARVDVARPDDAAMNAGADVRYLLGKLDKLDPTAT